MGAFDAGYAQFSSLGWRPALLDNAGSLLGSPDVKRMGDECPSLSVITISTATGAKHFALVYPNFTGSPPENNRLVVTSLGYRFVLVDSIKVGTKLPSAAKPVVEALAKMEDALERVLNNAGGEAVETL